MYSINVFLTFTLTLLGMVRHWLAAPRRAGVRGATSPSTARASCSARSILCVTVYEKFEEGGWLTVVVTASFVALAFLIRRHYARVRDAMRRIDDTLLEIPVRPHEPVEDGGPAGRARRRHARQRVHRASASTRCCPSRTSSRTSSRATCSSRSASSTPRTSRASAEIEALKTQTEEDLKKYVDFAQRLGFRADYRYDVGTEAVEEVVELCESVQKEFPRSIFFLGQLVFENDRFYYRFLHNETAFAIQRRLQFGGLQAVVLPIRVLERVTRGKKARAA